MDWNIDSWIYLNNKKKALIIVINTLHYITLFALARDHWRWSHTYVLLDKNMLDLVENEAIQHYYYTYFTPVVPLKRCCSVVDNTTVFNWRCMQIYI